MNLQNLNLVELNAQEMEETQGGFWFAVAILVVFGIIALLGYDVDVK